MSSSEEYGLRCLTRLALHERAGATEPIGIPEIAAAEGLGVAHAAKIMRSLRQAGLVQAFRGARGGYRLVSPPEQVTLRDVLAGVEGGSVLQQPCGSAPCGRDGDCTLRVLWGSLDGLLGSLLDSVTLADLLGSEETIERLLRRHTLPTLEASP